MPKAPRVTKCQGIYRCSPITIVSAPTASSQSVQLPKPESPEETMQPSHQQYGMNGGPVQPHYPSPVQVMPTSTSSAWTPQNDEILLTARARGMNWQPIQQQHFPNKTPNACRKRHERLITAKSTNDDWENKKMKELAEAYVGLREKIWKPLADLVGEKWTVVETKCMQQGIKNLQGLARSYNREQRLQENSQSVTLQHPVSHVSHPSGHTRHPSQLHTPVMSYNNGNRNSVGSYNDGDDSGISGIGFDTDTGYSPNGGDTGFRSSGEYNIPNEQQQQQQQQQQQMQRSEEHWSVRAMQQRGDTLSVMQQHPQQSQPTYGRIEQQQQQQRYSLPTGVPSTDMRIPALINGPGNVLNGMNGSHDSGMGGRRSHESSMNGNGMNGHLNGRS